MENAKAMGPQKTPAAVLFLWGFLYSFVEIVVVNGTRPGHISLSAAGWVFRLCSLGTIILLFRGKRNIGFTVFWGLLTLLSARYLFISFGLYNLIWLAADGLMLLVVICATIPSFSDRKNPLKNLEFIPAGLHLLPYILILLSPAQHRAMYYINALISSLAWWFMAAALTANRAQETAQTAGQNSYRTYVPPAAQPRSQSVQPAPTPAANQGGGFGVLLVRFSIDSLNKLSGSYGFQSGKLIGQVVPPSLLEGMTISDGDSAATLRGSEYVCIVSISTVSNSSILKERIEPLILASEDIKACGAPPLTQTASSINEPLVVDGIVRNGKIEGPGGWCASGFMSAWKEQGENSSKTTETTKT